MGISVEEMKKMDESTCQIIDIRSQIEIEHGAIAGACQGRLFFTRA